MCKQLKSSAWRLGCQLSVGMLGCSGGPETCLQSIALLLELTPGSLSMWGGDGAEGSGLGVTGIILPPAHGQLKQLGHRDKNRRESKERRAKA